MSVTGLFTPRTRVHYRSRKPARPFFGTQAAQTTETAIPLKEIENFLRFHQIGECCGDVEFPSSLLTSPAPPGDVRVQHATAIRRSSKTQILLIIKYADWSSHLIGENGFHAAAHAPHVGSKRPLRTPIQNIHQAAKAALAQYLTFTFEQSTFA
jgi:hypothetical protein